MKATITLAVLALGLFAMACSGDSAEPETPTETAAAPELDKEPTATEEPTTEPTVTVPTDTPEPPPATVPPPPPTEPPVLNRLNCDAISGTPYRSEEERLWYLDNCTAPPPTVPPPPPPVPPPADDPPPQANCSPSYPTVCIPPYPPDLNCGDISFRRFQVLPPDRHGFDGDNDGIGCESG